MIEPPKNINVSTEQIYMYLGFISAFLSSGVRLMRNKENFTSLYAVTRSIVDALTCAFLSYGVFEILNAEWNVPISTLIFIGTFVGSLGSTTIINLFSMFLKNYIGRK